MFFFLEKFLRSFFQKATVTPRSFVPPFPVHLYIKEANMKATPKNQTKTKKYISALALLCALATVLGIAVVGFTRAPASLPVSADAFDDTYADGSRALDYNSCTYRIDENGNLWEENEEYIRLVYGKKDALLVSLWQNEIYILTYSSEKGSFLSRLSLTDGALFDTALLADGKVTAFSASNKGFYCLSDGKVSLFERETKKTSEILDLAKLDIPFSDSFCDEHENADLSLSTCEKFTLDGEKGVIFYINNPCFVDESDGETDGLGENDEYLAYVYSFEEKTLSEYLPDDISPSEISNLADGDKITLNGVTVPFSKYPPYASYFTKNGRGCTCHNRNQCLNNAYPCNCLRYITYKGSTFDLAATQCFGFARYCQLMIFGHTDASASGKYVNALGGSWSGGSFTANDIMEVFTKYGAGGHIRTRAGHSLFVISVNATGFTTYECNTNNKDCLVYTRNWTWATFYNSAKARGLYYYKIPTDFSSGTGEIVDNYPTGSYLIDAEGGLRLRSAATTSSTILATIPDGTIINISETVKIDGAATNRWWGKTTYDGKTGWVSLDYARFQSEITGIKITATPERTTFYQNEAFSYDGLEIQLMYSSGIYGTLPAGYTVTPPNMSSEPGTYKVTVTYLGFSASYEITIKRSAVMPKSIEFERETITVMTGGEFTPVYGVDYNIVPADADDKTVAWSVVSGGHLVSVDESTGVVTAAKAGANFVDGYARVRAKSLAKNYDGVVSSVYKDYIIEVIKAPEDGAWSQPATNLPDGVTLSDYLIEYCTSAANFEKGNWVKYTGRENGPFYKFRFRDSYKLTWYYDPSSTDGDIELPSSFGYPSSANIGEKVSLSRLKAITQTNKIFAGWFTTAEGARTLNKSLAYKGSAINSDTEFFAGWIDLASEEFLINAAENDPSHTVGESLRAFGVFTSGINISDENGGLRFYGHISTAFEKKLQSLSSTPISYGMIVRMASKATGPLTSSTAVGNLSSGKALVVTAKKNYGKFSFKDSGEYTVFTSLAVNIPIEDAKTALAARAFVTYYDINGNRRTFYYTNTSENTPAGVTLRGSGISASLYTCAEKIYATVSEAEKNWLIENILGHDYE